METNQERNKREWKKVKKVAIIGAGSQARIVFDILKSQKKYQTACFIEVCDNKSIWNTKIRNIKILGGVEEIKNLKSKNINYYIVAFGDNRRRAELAELSEKCGLKPINAVHKSAIISKYAKIGNNCTISQNAIVNCDAVIGNNVIINTGAIIEHDCKIGNNAHIASSVCLAGHVDIGENTLVGVGAKVIQGRKIGKNVVIGAGAVVIDDIPDNVTALGVPAEIIKH